MAAEPDQVLVELRHCSTADEGKPAENETGRRGGWSCDDVLARAADQSQSAATMHDNGNSRRAYL